MGANIWGVIKKVEISGRRLTFDAFVFESPSLVSGVVSLTLARLRSVARALFARVLMSCFFLGFYA